jgi:hypothetical protein
MSVPWKICERRCDRLRPRHNKTTAVCSWVDLIRAARITSYRHLSIPNPRLLGFVIKEPKEGLAPSSSSQSASISLS